MRALSEGKTAQALVEAALAAAFADHPKPAAKRKS
jgi:hypothetical protein